LATICSCTLALLSQPTCICFYSFGWFRSTDRQMSVQTRGSRRESGAVHIGGETTRCSAYVRS